MIDPIEVPPPPPARLLIVALYALVVVLAWGGTELWGLGKAPFHTKGEPREGLVVWEMTHGGGWVLPRRNGVELPSKPPLFHWLGAVTSLVHGNTDEWSIRFPSAALSLGALLCVFAAGTALWTPRAGLVSALTLMTTFEWARAATGARVDMTLTFGLQLALFSLLFFLRPRRPGWLLPLYAGIILAVLGKGPVGAALPGLVALSMLLIARDFGPLREMRLGTGALAVTLGAGSWYLMALVLGGWAFFRKQVLAENLFTFLNSPQFGGGHRHPATYLLGALLLGMLPWTLCVPAAVSRLWRQRGSIGRTDGRLFLLVWIAIVFGFYAIAASKRSVYLLGLYPAVALLLGWWWDEQMRAASEDADDWVAPVLAYSAWTLLVATGLLLLGIVLENLGAPVVTTVQRFLAPAAVPVTHAIGALLRSARWPLLGLLLLLALTLAATIRAAAARHWVGLFAAVCITIVTTIIAVNQVIMPGIAQYQSLRRFMSAVRAVVGPHGGLFFYKAFEYEAVFYWGAHIPSYDGPWTASAPPYLLMDKSQWEEAQRTGQGQFQLVPLPEDADGGSDQRLVLIRRVDAP